MLSTCIKLSISNNACPVNQTSTNASKKVNNLKLIIIQYLLNKRVSVSNWFHILAVDWYVLIPVDIAFDSAIVPYPSQIFVFSYNSWRPFFSTEETKGLLIHGRTDFFIFVWISSPDALAFVWNRVQHVLDLVWIRDIGLFARVMHIR